MSLIPATILTGFLGSGKTTLLKRILSEAHGQKIAVIENEFGEENIDNDILVSESKEQIVQMSNGCICCTIREDLREALQLLAAKKRKGLLDFDRVVIETTGLADPGPILYTLLNEPVLQHHFQLGNVITTVDAVNAALHLSKNPEGMKQVAAADHLLVTKTDLASDEQIAAVRAVLAQVNPSAHVRDAIDEPLDVDGLLDVRPPKSAPAFVPAGDAGATDTLHALRRHSQDISSFSLVLDEPLDWTAFGVWLSLLLHRYGDDVLRVKGILSVQGSAAPVFMNAVQHVVHPPQHLETWSTEDRRSRIVFITRGIDHGRLRRSLEAFCRLRVAELSVSA